LFEGEAGGHRWQRVPPNEKRGRVHTSTITVAVLPEPKHHEIHIDPKELRERFTCGSGAGGQHRNKNATAVQLTHIPSGLTVRAESEKSQKQNRENALALLRAKLLEQKKSKAKKARFKMRQDQVGSGMRGDKIRTIRVRHNQVVDHVSGKQITYKDYSRGKLWGLKSG
jgi:peptide chain release factor 1